MHHLKLRRSQQLWPVRGLLVVIDGDVQFDLNISSLFFQESFRLSDRWWTTLVHESMGYLLGLVHDIQSWHSICTTSCRSATCAESMARKSSTCFWC